MNPPIASPDTPPSPARGILATFGIALVGTAGAVALFMFAIDQMRQRHVGGYWILAAAALYGAAILAIAYGASRVGQRLSRTKPTPAARRYRRRFFIAMTAYVAVLMTSAAIFAEVHPPVWVDWLLALAPAVAIMASIVVMGLYLREETDELERAIASESALWATGGLLAIATSWGFLEQFHLVVHVETWAAFPLWAFCLGIANIFVRRRYR